MNLTKFIDDVPTRLVYSLYIPENINSINEDKSLLLHFTCLEHICLINDVVFNDIRIVICTNNKNEEFIDDIKIRLSSIFIYMPKVSFVKEHNDSFRREGRIFDEYVINHLEEYDGITLFFHNKGLRPSFITTDEDVMHWIIGQYFFCMNNSKYTLEDFINNDALVYGWPFMHDNYHSHFLIGGSCFWMKCKDIFDYINQNEEQSQWFISKRCAAEYWTITNLPIDKFLYPDFHIIKNCLNVKYYEPGIDHLFVEYLKNTTIYNTYVQYEDFYNKIMTKYNESIL